MSRVTSPGSELGEFGDGEFSEWSRRGSGRLKTGHLGLRPFKQPGGCEIFVVEGGSLRIGRRQGQRDLLAAGFRQYRSSSSFSSRVMASPQHRGTAVAGVSPAQAGRLDGEDRVRPDRAARGAPPRKSSRP